MSAGRRFVLLGAGAAVGWYVCILIFWALQPLADAVPVGVDYTLKPPAFVSVTVECKGLFDGAPRDDSPLPTLKAQPKDVPPLAYQREACAIVHRQARVLFVLDTALVLALVLAVVLGCSWLALRRRTSSSPGQITTDPSLVGLRAG